MSREEHSAWEYSEIADQPYEFIISDQASYAFAEHMKHNPEPIETYIDLLHSYETQGAGMNNILEDFADSLVGTPEEGQYFIYGIGLSHKLLSLQAEIQDVELPRITEEAILGLGGLVYMIPDDPDAQSHLGINREPKNGKDYFYSRARRFDDNEKSIANDLMKWLSSLGENGTTPAERQAFFIGAICVHDILFQQYYRDRLVSAYSRSAN